MAKGSVTLRPKFLHCLKKRRVCRRPIHEVRSNNLWLSHIQGALTVGVILEFLSLWDLVKDVILQLMVSDYHIWRLSSSGQYSATLAFKNLFHGTSSFQPYT